MYFYIPDMPATEYPALHSFANLTLDGRGYAINGWTDRIVIVMFLPPFVGEKICLARAAAIDAEHVASYRGKDQPTTMLAKNGDFGQGVAIRKEASCQRVLTGVVTVLSPRDVNRPSPAVME